MKLWQARLLKFFTFDQRRHIPLGPYCYRTIQRSADGSCPKIKPCRYYREATGSEAAWCEYCKYGDDTLLDDMVKVCGEYDDIYEA